MGIQSPIQTTLEPRPGSIILSRATQKFAVSVTQQVLASDCDGLCCLDHASCDPPAPGS